MSKKLFVGGLSWGMSDETLREAFERFGSVLEAMRAMDGTTLDGRTINVNEARERAPRGDRGDRGGDRGPRGGGRGGGGGGGRRDRW